MLIICIGCKENKVYRIGVSQCSQDDWRTKMNDEIEREAMLNDDVEVEIRSADDNSARQIEDIRYFVDNGFDLIAIAPNEAETLTPIIKEVYKKGIPVIIFDRDIIGDTYTARIGADNEDIGRSAARYALNLTGSGAGAIEICGLSGSTPAEGCHKGFVSEFAASGGRILASAPANWNGDMAMTVADSLLSLHPEADLIYAHNDRMAIGAFQAAHRRGLDSIKIIGIDAAPDIGIRAVADGLIDATFLYPTEGHRLIQTAKAILKGEPYQRDAVMPASSAVDRTNADILLLQNETLKQETNKMRILKSRIDDYWAKHSAQTLLFYASIAIIALLLAVVFLSIRAYWQSTRHRRELVAKNQLLEQERDRQERLNKQLEEATHSKLMFFTNVSHDLRTPLTLIAEPVAQLSGADNLTQQQQALMAIADKNVHILMRLINQILDFRKYQNEKLTLNLAETDFGTAVREWIQSFYALARKRNIKLALQSPATSEPLETIAIDQEKIERLLFNLLSNAFKHTPDNGSITVSYTIDTQRLIFSVADTGQGISPDDLGNIFDRFFQADKVHPRGSGIGLSLSKAFVELHGGEITVDSTLGRGSVFTVTLPVRHVDTKAAAAATEIDSMEVSQVNDDIEMPLSNDPGKPLLLIIDDNRDIQQLVGQLMNDQYNIITATDGQSGLAKAAKHVPDIIICDIMMPVMDGMECCRRLKNEVTTSHIPVLMLTACSMDEQRADGYDSGADGYLSKPFSAKVLRSQCASLIANRRRIKDLWSGPLALNPTPRPSVTPITEVQEVRGDLDNEFYTRFAGLFMSEMGNSELSVEVMASKMGLERSQFYRKIKAITNYAPVELMRLMRLQRARTLIITTEKNISEIAYDCGFSTPAYFTKCYREAFGVSPTQARENMGK